MLYYRFKFLLKYLQIYIEQYLKKINALNNWYGVSIIEKSSKKTMSKIKKYKIKKVYKNFYKLSGKILTLN